MITPGGRKARPWQADRHLSRLPPRSGAPTGSFQVPDLVLIPFAASPAADLTGRTTPTSGLPVGEELPLDLEPTQPPRRSQLPIENWRQERGTLVRLRLECRRDGWEPWVLTGEIYIISNGRPRSKYRRPESSPGQPRWPPESVFAFAQVSA